MRSIIALLFLSIFLVPSLTHAQSESIGQVTFIKGNASVTRLNAEKKELLFNDPIFPMDTLETKKGELKVLLSDETILSLGENSKLLITEYVYKPKQGSRNSIFDILKGSVRAVIEQTGKITSQNEVKLQTPTAVAGIRGTDVGIQVQNGTTSFVCFEGAFEAFFKGAPTQTVLVQTGQGTQINNAPPTPPAPIPAPMMQTFESQLTAPSPEEAGSQPGGDALNSTAPDQLPPPPAGDQKPTGPAGAPQGDKSSQNEQSDTQATEDRQLQAGTNNGLDPNAPQQDQAATGSLPKGFMPPPNMLSPTGGPLGIPPGGAFLPPPPILPGGTKQTPTGANPNSPNSNLPTAPVNVPVSFPAGAQE